jgi:transposase
MVDASFILRLGLHTLKSGAIDADSGGEASISSLNMNDLSVTKPYQRRRRFSREFKAQIVAQCLEPGASVSRISLDNGLNANMVRRWISEARRAPKAPATTPGFVPVNLPTLASAQSNQSINPRQA